MLNASVEIASTSVLNASVEIGSTSVLNASANSMSLTSSLLNNAFIESFDENETMLYVILCNYETMQELNWILITFLLRIY